MRKRWPVLCVLLSGVLRATITAEGMDAMHSRGEPPPRLGRGKSANVVAPSPVKISSDSEFSDLLKLSLHELYNLEILQMTALGAHTHPAKQIMFGYRFMYMNMDGIRSGSRGISAGDVFAAHPEFNVAHLSMKMEEHMFEWMYAPSDRVTLMAMLPYKEMSMVHTTPANKLFTQRASGIGDLQGMATITLLGDAKKKGHRLLLNVGMSFPTGSTNVRDHELDDPGHPLQKLEYPMQLGSGTFDLLPGLTYLGESGKWAWGAQSIQTIRLGRNSSGYRFGNHYGGSAWVAYGVADWLAPYFRIEGRVRDNISGRDSAYGAVPMNAEASPNLQAGERINALFGLNVYVPRGTFKGHRITVEGGLPIYEHLTGPQLGLGWTINVGWTYGF